MPPDKLAGYDLANAARPMRSSNSSTRVFFSTLVRLVAMSSPVRTFCSTVCQGKMLWSWKTIDTR